MHRSLLKQIINLIFPQAAMLFSTWIIIVCVCVCVFISLCASLLHTTITMYYHSGILFLSCSLDNKLSLFFFFFWMVNSLMLRTVLQPEAWGHFSPAPSISLSPAQDKLPPILHSGFANLLITLKSHLSLNTPPHQEALEAPLTFFIFRSPASKIMPRG